jgi:hypothetical protein
VKEVVLTLVWSVMFLQLVISLTPLAINSNMYGVAGFGEGDHDSIGQHIDCHFGNLHRNVRFVNGELSVHNCAVYCLLFQFLHHDLEAPTKKEA